MKKVIALLIVLSSSAIAGPPPGYVLKFKSNFQNNQLNVGAGPGVPVVQNWGLLPTYQLGNAWVAQFIGAQPNGRAIGDAYITQPQDGYPYPVWIRWGQLVFTIYWDTAQSHWRSAMLATVDTTGHGFTQALGYWQWSFTVQNFQAAWIGAWLKGLEDIPYLKPQTKNVSEIDVELYGHNSAVAQAAVHDWTPSGSDVANQVVQMAMPSGTWSGRTTESLQSGSHTYGILITTSAITYFIDGVQTWQTSNVPASAQEPLYALFDVELGGGYIDPPSSAAIPPVWLQSIECYAPEE
jgi:hypothetical protein